MKSKHELELRRDEKDEHGKPKLSGATVQKEATEVYRQLFSLMSDEFSPQPLPQRAVGHRAYGSIAFITAR